MNILNLEILELMDPNGLSHASCMNFSDINAKVNFMHSVGLVPNNVVVVLIFLLLMSLPSPSIGIF